MDWERTRMRAENMSLFGEDAATKWAGETILQLLDMVTRYSDFRILEELWKENKVKNVPLIHTSEGEIKVNLALFKGNPRKFRWLVYAVDMDDTKKKAIELHRRRIEALGDSLEYRENGKEEKK